MFYLTSIRDSHVPILHQNWLLLEVLLRVTGCAARHHVVAKRVGVAFCIDTWSIAVKELAIWSCHSVVADSVHQCENSTR